MKTLHPPRPASDTSGKARRRRSHVVPGPAYPP